MSTTVVKLRNVYDVVYEIRGTECVRVFLPEGTDIPSNWNSLSLQERDEWLYENQENVDFKWKDIDRGDTVQIMEVK